MKLLPIANSNPAASGGPIASVPASTAVPQSLRTNISWSFLGLAAYAASQWGMLVVLARLTSPAVVGQFTISLALTGPILLLAGLDLRIVQAADASRRFAFSDYFGLRLIVALLAFAVVTVLSLALGYESTVATVIVAMGLAKSLELQSDAFHGLFQQRERMDLFARSLLVRGAVSLVLFAAAMVLTQSLTVGVAALAASTLIVLFWCDVPNAVQFLPGGCAGLLNSPVAPRRLARLFVVALPAGLRSFLLALESSLPLLLLQQYHGDSAVGSFAALTYTLVVVQTFARSLNQPAIPRLAMLSLQGDAAGFYRLLGRLCAFGVVLGGAGLLAVIGGGRLFLRLAYGHIYADQYPIFVILMASCAIRLVGLPIAAALAALNCFTTLFVTQIVTVVLLGCLSTVLVPLHGLYGAAYATCVVSIVMLVGQAAVAVVWLPVLLKGQTEPVRLVAPKERLPSAA